MNLLELSRFGPRARRLKPPNRRDFDNFATGDPVEVATALNVSEPSTLGLLLLAAGTTVVRRRAKAA